MNCTMVMDDWRRKGTPGSIYQTPLGMELSMGDLHSGTAFRTTVYLPPDVADEIITAWHRHKAYPVMRLIPDGRAQ